MIAAVNVLNNCSSCKHKRSLGSARRAARAAWTRPCGRRCYTLNANTPFPDTSLGVQPCQPFRKVLKPSWQYLLYSEDMSQAVRITNVAPRDGLQNEAAPIPTLQKAELVSRLIAANVDEIEVSSFVSSKWIPQLGDAAEVFHLVQSLKPADMVFSALVPNDKGLSAALEINGAAGKRIIDKVSVFAAASETFSRKNTNTAIAESLERFRILIPRAKAAGLLVRGYISCIIACPFEGPISPAAVISIARKLLELGVDELDYGDTIGAADPRSLSSLLVAHSAAFGDAHLTDSSRFTLHLHDTFGRAAACALEAFSMGVRSFDSAAGGLGGCPYASTPGKQAPGNIDTEDLVKTLLAAGASTRVDQKLLASAATFARALATTPTL